jgi:F-type H+-transporting ATPase subunit b
VLADLYNDHSVGPLFPHWEEIIPALLFFALTLYIVGWKLIPRISKQLEDRSKAIEGGIERADTIQAEAAKQLAEYRSTLAEARHDAAKAREEAREQGAQIIAEAREHANAEAKRMVEEAQRQLQQDVARARDELRPEVERLSVELAGRVVGEPIER